MKNSSRETPEYPTDNPPRPAPPAGSVLQKYKEKAPIYIAVIVGVLLIAAWFLA